MSCSAHSPLPWRGLLHLSVVYVVWSSTYLAIRVAVRPGAGFPPFAMAAGRCLLAFPLLLLWARARGLRILPTRGELPMLAIAGIMLWTCGNAFVVVAEQRMTSGLAAILIATTPLCVALLEAMLAIAEPGFARRSDNAGRLGEAGRVATGGRWRACGAEVPEGGDPPRVSMSTDLRAPSPQTALSLLVGFSGTVLVGYPSLRHGARADVWAVALVIIAAFSWGGGSLLQRRHPLKLDAMVSAAYQMLFGGLGIAALSLVFREPTPNPTPVAWLGFAFLLVFGSLIAFTSFLKALHLLPTRVAFTYAYVNPVAAALLGWLLLGEQISAATVAGTVLVLLGVAGIFRARR